VHKTVLLGEAIELLNLKSGMTVVDATLGAGGHSWLAMKKVGKQGTLIALDLDETAIKEFKERVNSEFDETEKPQIHLIKGNFKDIDVILKKIKIKKVDAILADLGWRLDQVKDKKYGMSFQIEAPLDMRLGKEGELTAYKVVNSWEEKDLVEIFFKYGEEKNSRKIARAIVDFRKNKKIETTKELAGIIEKVNKSFSKRAFNPATKVFQALRIVVNDEIGNLEKFLEKSIEVLNKKARIGIISFHSLEDRLVKKFFRVNTRGCICPKELPICVCDVKRKLKIITKKPVIAGEKELKENTRARSAKLRIAERL
jgi:16S rRNA (cytosine1402-N4)-methyltransferase